MSTPSPEFVALVKDALEHLYDPAVLETHEMGRRLLPDSLPAGTSRALALRQALLDAIDELNPRHALPVGARQRRLHQIVELRYVEALSFREVMAQLALSQAQYHREQRHAIDALAILLWERAAEGAQPTAEEALVEHRPPTAYSELDAATQGAPGSVDLSDVASGVVDILRGVARDRDVTVVPTLPATPTMVRGTRTGLRQIIITVAGFLLSGARGGRLLLRADEAGQQAALVVAYEAPDPAAPACREEVRLEVARRLLEPLGGSLDVEATSSRVTARIKLSLSRQTLLVVDDNPDMVHLVRRLVAPKRYSVLGAGSVQEGLGLARSAKPGAILLDLMLPEQDGWDALQALKHDPATHDIPVLVCSVLDEEQLALALGAVEFVRKPLTRPDLLAALARWLDEGRSPGEGHPAPPRPGDPVG